MTYVENQNYCSLSIMKDILKELGFYFIRNKQYLAFFSIINSR